MGLPSALSSRAARITMVMSCWFTGMGVLLPFLPRWLEVERGLDGAQIGIVLASAQLARIATGPVIAFWGDGAADRRLPLRLLSLAAIAAYAGFFFVARDFVALLVFGFLALTLTQSLVPFIEAATLRATAAGRLSYGIARGIGSSAFIAGNVIGGLLIARFGVEVVVAWMLSSLVLCALTSWFGLERDAAPGDDSARAAGVRWEAAKQLLRRRRFVLVIVACGLIQAAHAFYYGFSTMVWRAQGVDAGTIGLLWAFGTATEVAFLWSLPVIERRLSPQILILLGAAGALVRWTAFGFAPTGMILWPLQMLHALTFAAAHVGAMRLIYREAPEMGAAVAQTLYASLSGGLLIGAAMVGSGFLYDLVGARGYWAMAAMAALGGVFALMLLADDTRERRNMRSPQTRTACDNQP